MMFNKWWGFSRHIIIGVWMTLKTKPYLKILKFHRSVFRFSGTWHQWYRREDIDKRALCKLVYHVYHTSLMYSRVHEVFCRIPPTENYSDALVMRDPPHPALPRQLCASTPVSGSGTHSVTLPSAADILSALVHNITTPYTRVGLGTLNTSGLFCWNILSKPASGFWQRWAIITITYSAITHQCPNFNNGLVDYS